MTEMGDAGLNQTCKLATFPICRKKKRRGGKRGGGKGREEENLYNRMRGNLSSFVSISGPQKKEKKREKKRGGGKRRERRKKDNCTRWAGVETPWARGLPPLRCTSISRIQRKKGGRKRE